MLGIICGIPIGLYMQSKSYVPQVRGWDFKVFSAHLNILTTWTDVLQSAEETDEDAVHIFAYEKHKEIRKKCEHDVRGKHRLIWLDSSILGQFASPEFDKAITKLCEFEQEWRDQIRPVDPKHPLILPEGSFETNRAHEQMWSRAQSVNRKHDDISKIETLIQSFRETYRLTYDKKTGWLDRNGRFFVIDRSKHRRSLPRMWKYTFDCDRRLHFDVNVEGNKWFFMKDQTGMSNRYYEHVNLDPHGKVLTGSR